MPIDWGAVNWVNVGLLSAFVFSAAACDFALRLIGGCVPNFAG
jgi:hypothetical protein